ncbi:MAG: hypothetical protein HY282_09995 [Nitrospirae bacterium]|nr:hypothetical protein [Candidatus Manganitrophaceae bacterium]
MKRFGFLWPLGFLAGLALGSVATRFDGIRPLDAEAAAPVKAVRAEAFELVNQQGQLRAKLQVGADGEPTLVVYDKNEKPTAAYGLNGDNPVQNFLGGILKR